MANPVYIPKEDGSGYYRATVLDGTLSLAPVTYTPPAPAPSPADTTTAADLIRAALLDLGVRAPNEAITASEMQDGLRKLNQMLASWNLDPLAIYTEEHPTFTLVPGKQDYTMGPGGDFSTLRPGKLDYCFFKFGTQGLEYKGELLEDGEWGAIALKSLPGLPVYCHNHGDYPLTTLSIWPIPQQTMQVTLYFKTRIPKFLSQNDLIVLPDGYERALTAGLAIECSAMYQTAPSPALLAIYQEAKTAIRRANLPSVDMKSDTAIAADDAISSNLASFYSGGLVK